MNQQIRFATSPDGIRLAYAIHGTGPPLVKVANWLSHLEFDWHSPVWRHWLTELGRDYLVVRYDERGSGLSDRAVPDFTFDAWVRDLEAVVDAAGLDRFSLFGMSQGGAVAIAYAVLHPERVTHLVLYGAYSRGRLARDPSAEQRAEAELLLHLRAWAGAPRTRPSGACSRCSFSRTRRQTTRLRSTSSSACRHRPRTLSAFAVCFTISR
jgi:pimeloyl-ACP methyl ester carboxylesterase